MSTITEEQYQLVHQYSELLAIIDEGFHYVLESFEDYSKTEGDLVLHDIFLAFTKVIQVNKDLAIIFRGNAEVINALHSFEQVSLAAEKLDGLFDHLEEKQSIVRQFFYPAFKDWYTMILPFLLEYAQ